MVEIAILSSLARHENGFGFNGCLRTRVDQPLVFNRSDDEGFGDAWLDCKNATGEASGIGRKPLVLSWTSWSLLVERTGHAVCLALNPCRSDAANEPLLEQAEDDQDWYHHHRCKCHDLGGHLRHLNPKIR